MNHLHFFLFSMVACCFFIPLSAQTTIETNFESSDPNLILSATVTTPMDDIPNAAVVLVSVAGPTDRDLSLGNHKYFKVLADGLADEGIASIRYDDRGVGESEGEFLSTDLNDRTMDACNAMQILKEQFPDVLRFGFIGMSEGAGISIKTTDLCPGASFIILLSPPVRPGRIEMKNQMSRLLAASFFSEEQKLEIEKEAFRFLELVGSDDPQKNRIQILELLKGKYGSVILPPYHFVPNEPEEKAEFVLSPWYQSQLNYDISDEITNLDIPSLAFYGSLDMSIDPVANKKDLLDLNSNITVRTFKGINHLMQEANTGSPMEYMFLPSSFSERIINEIAKWLKEG